MRGVNNFTVFWMHFGADLWVVGGFFVVVENDAGLLCSHVVFITIWWPLGYLSPSLESLTFGTRSRTYRLSWDVLGGLVGPWPSPSGLRTLAILQDRPRWFQIPLLYSGVWPQDPQDGGEGRLYGGELRCTLCMLRWHVGSR